jgi:hypothetical protein
MYVEVSREEWVFRGLAIATILALVGMAVMPVLSVGNITAYYASQGGDPYVSAGGLIVSAGLLKATDIVLLLELAGCAIAFPLTVILIAGSVIAAA